MTPPIAPNAHAGSTLTDPPAIARRLIAWHDEHQRILPWRSTRAGRRDPYSVWVAEIMLQQTRVEVARHYFVRWMERFPTLASLAAADLDDVLKLWEGLGYYARARNLHRTARILVEERGGEFPQERAALLALPGIGAYSAGALLSVAFGQTEPLLDGNVKRVLSRLADVAEPVDAAPTVKHLWNLARALVEAAPPGEAGVLNEALIELGAVVCVPARPRCLLCPVEALCRARRNGTQEQRPVRAPRKQTPHYDVAAGVIWQGEPYAASLLIAQRPHTGLLGGLWEFPGGKREEADADLRATLAREIAEELGITIEVGAQAAVVKHAFSHFRITLHAFHARHIAGEPQAIGCAAWRWVTLEELDAFAMGTADRRILTALLTNRPATQRRCLPAERHGAKDAQRTATARKTSTRMNTDKRG